MDYKWHGTTILSLRRSNEVLVMGDGQVTFGSIVLKHEARKVRKLHGDSVIAGFAGATADALTLFERLEEKLDKYPRQLSRAAVELAKDWRTDKYLRKLEAMMAVADKNISLLISGNGDVLEPEKGLIGIGSGGPYALAAARALYDKSDLPLLEIATYSMKIASELCIYTNEKISFERITF